MTGINLHWSCVEQVVVRMGEPNICESCKHSVWDAELVLIEHSKKWNSSLIFVQEASLGSILHDTKGRKTSATFNLGCVPILKKQK